MHTYNTHTEKKRYSQFMSQKCMTFIWNFHCFQTFCEIIGKAVVPTDTCTRTKYNLNIGDNTTSPIL